MQHAAFPTQNALAVWLEEHHGSATELWVRVFKMGSKVASVTWADCVVAAIAWGWIDGQKKPFDDISYLQRLTPRKAKSNWSQKNREHAERLISQGRMMPSGLRHVREAKADGRWENAYAGQANLTIPQDFLDALQSRPEAKAFFETLDRKNLYPIYYRLATAKQPGIRARRMQKLIEQLSRQERFH